MLGFTIRRLLLVIPALLGASLIVFLSVFALPGDPATMLGGGRISEEARAVLEEKHNLDEPVWAQYGLWATAVVQGDLGESIATRRPVSDMLGETLPNTLKLAGLALLIEAVVGVSVGVIAAISHRRFVDILVVVTTTLLVAIPIYVLGSALQYMLGLKWDVLPVSGVDDGFRSWILPALVLALASLAYVSRLTRTSLAETEHEGYVEMAVAKGLSPSRVMFNHRLRNALVPVVTFLAIDFGVLLGGALFVETIFNINGMGQMTVKAIGQRDVNVIVGCTLVFVVGYMLANLIADVAVAYLDPWFAMSDPGAETVVVAEDIGPSARSSPSGDALRHIVRRPTFWLAIAVVALFAAMAVVPALFVAPSPASHDPRECSLRDESGEYQDRLPPSSEHWFGTDLQGCDYYARVIYGARASMAVGLLVVVIGGTIAIVLGGLAGYAGGWVDTGVSRLIDVFLGFPLVVAAILLLTAVAGEHRSIPEVALVLGLLSWPLATRLFRSSVQQTRSTSYIDAARTIGLSSTRTVVRHVLPNSLTPLLVYGALAIGAALLAEAGLAFLGVGLSAPTISWGQMINSAQERLEDSPHLLFFPGLFLTVAILAFLALGDLLRRAMDPRER